MNLKLLSLQGKEARPYLPALTRLRLNVFYDFPYLYQGSEAYEQKYLETYFRAQHSVIVLVGDGDDWVGATTGILASEEEPGFQQPLQRFGLYPAEVFYFGESVLMPAYRGRGLGKAFFQQRENYARSLGCIKWLAFCAVVRPFDHPLKPPGYRPLDEFWQAQGFQPEPGLTTTYEWKDRDQEMPSSKLMQFWLKRIN
jgi:GNAT superfamily N-acetyltransferase